MLLQRVGKNLLFFAIEPERTYAMKGVLSFGYLCLYTVCDISKSLPHCWVMPQRAVLVAADVTRDILTMKQAAEYNGSNQRQW